ncbi:MAG: 16S rRNA (adenine(1518)-N(6)/adenine(1519)-N(6))-dimethyltransferase RsmA [bacterium]
MDDGLPPLRDVIAEFGLGARKSLGQHFLLDLNITRKIARLADIHAGDYVIEVGPGPGGLTRALLEQGAHVIAIEKDRRCIDALKCVAQAYPDKLTLIEDDALKVNEADILSRLSLSQPVKLVSNLPYNISTELLVKWLKSDPRFWSSLTLMFQKEVAQRILASPGNKTYGRLSVIAQAASCAVHGFDLPARAFTPPPKIDSTIVHFTPYTSQSFSIDKLEQVTAAAFSQRRKMLRSSLKSLFQETTMDTLSVTGLSPTIRAENLTVANYIELAKLL